MHVILILLYHMTRYKESDIKYSESVLATHLLTHEKVYQAYKEDMFEGEISILTTLSFHAHFEHAYGFTVNYLQALDLHDESVVLQKCWNTLNDL